MHDNRATPGTRPATAERAEVQAGRTNDKIPGFDPAAAPMESDAEAGGASVSSGASAPSGPSTRPPETSYATAMRGPNGATAARSGWRLPIIVFGLFIVVAAAALFGMVGIVG